MKMVHMNESKSAGKLNMPTEVGSGKGPNYPYGLRLDLHDASLKKLGVTGKMPAVGSKVHLHAHARVVSTEMRKQGDGNTSQHMALQIEHMAMSGRSNSALDAVNGGVEDADKDGE
jgi:Major coat protein-like